MTSLTHIDDRAAGGAGGQAVANDAGLSEAEAQRRLPERPSPAPTRGSRSYGSIVRANVFTVFNLILATFGTVTLLYGDWRDALFLGILLVNTGVGIAQEVRAKRALDRLSALVAPTATVVRDGRARPLHVDDVVPGDLVRVAPGDQLVADGRLVAAEGLALDESILSGESAPIRRGPGEGVRSGSFAVEGRGSYLVEAVGSESYAERIAGEARAFRHPRSPLERAFNRSCWDSWVSCCRSERCSGCRWKGATRRSRRRSQRRSPRWSAWYPRA